MTELIVYCATVTEWLHYEYLLKANLLYNYYLMWGGYYDIEIISSICSIYFFMAVFCFLKNPRNDSLGELWRCRIYAFLGFCSFLLFLVYGWILFHWWIRTYVEPYEPFSMVARCIINYIFS